ncbi:two-partner secretion domain-containing protein [Chroococcidiopsis sp.]|uniref:two-partner secretion domain-containing protein n=1 Tax=Chroococcidiopsis sp. TaxID=3088168 RepID=UPI003F32531C
MRAICAKWSEKLARVSLGAIAVALACYCDSAIAQITPDNTMGGENSRVTSSGEVDAINGGATRGANLFHSFEEFNVDEGRAAIFNNSAGVENILTRVTGANPSNILGTLGVAGNANLFLLNPNGIIFGANARLDVGESFVATTADAVGFGERGEFSATNPINPGLLTVNPSALLFNQMRAAAIQNNSVADSGLNPSSDFTARGLRVPDGKSLLLVGGDISMNSGGLYAFGGRVELGGLAIAGTVGLNGEGNNLSLSFPNSVERSDVFLSNGAQVNVTAGNGGSIAVNVRNLEMTGGNSFLYAGIANGLGSDNSQAGNIEVNATGAINLNNGGLIANQVAPEARGQGGDVRIGASTLRLQGGAQVGAGTFGAGKGGSLTVDATNVQLIGTSADGEFSSSLYTSAQPNSTGDAGDLTLKTNTLLARDGAVVFTGTYGAGKGGNLSIDVQDVQLIGKNANSLFPSGLAADAQPNSTGDAGDLTLKTNTLLARDGASVFTGTYGAGKGGNLSVDAQNVQLIGTSADGHFTSSLNASAQPNSTGDAGDLTLKTNTLLARDGATVFTGSFSAGKGGNLSVDAQDVQLIGISADGQTPSALAASTQPNSTGNAGDLTLKTNTLLARDGAVVFTGTYGAGKGGNLSIDAQDVQLIGTSADGHFTSALAASTQPNSTGNAGDLTIKTNTLLVRDGAGVSVQSLGTGTAGNMTLNARSIRLNNYASLSANTQSAKVDPNGEQATININSKDLFISRNSNIFTNATGENVIGGNINIDTDFLIAAENSDISANSANFRGGNVRIDASGIFGTQFRAAPDDRTSDITATGGNPQLSGSVELDVPEIDPNSGLVNLPSVLVDTQVAQTCTPSNTQAQSEFIVTGRGGLPPNPTQVLSSDAISVDWVALEPTTENQSSPTPTTNSTAPLPTPIVEATGWVIDRQGEVILTASNVPAQPHNSRQSSAGCKPSTPEKK